MIHNKRVGIMLECAGALARAGKAPTVSDAKLDAAVAKFDERLAVHRATFPGREDHAFRLALADVRVWVTT